MPRHAAPLPAPLSPRLLLAGLLAIAPLAPALAQAPAPAAAASQLAETVLHLSETAQVTRAPDEIQATLRAEARGANAAAVQAQVNRAIQAALGKAQAVSALRASTGGYWTHRTEENRQWVASQGLSLRGREAGPLLELTGTLQADGLALAELGWSLSDAAEKVAKQEAGRLAIAALRQRAQDVAQQLGLRVAGIRSLRLDTPERPMPRLMAARASSAPAPAAAPEEVEVMATAEAEIILQP